MEADSPDAEYGTLEPLREAVYTNEIAEDWRDWDCIALELEIPEEAAGAVELTFHVYPLMIGRPEYIECTTAKVTVAGAGWRTVEVSFDQFDAMRMTRAFWRFIHRVGVTARYIDGDCRAALRVGRIRLKKQGRIGLSAPLLSQSAEAGETVGYKLYVENETIETQAVFLGWERYGFESMEARLQPEHIMLGPGEKKEAVLEVRVHDGIAPGGYEALTVFAVPNGDANYKKRLTFQTVRKLARPYLIHTEAGWEEVRRKADMHEWARSELARYVRKAEDWAVPETRGAGASYAFELHERFNFYAAAVAWKLTGRREFLEKAAGFLRRLADPHTGYPGTKAPVFHIRSADEPFPSFVPADVKVCGGGLIHEGEFFLSIASGYDLIHDAGILTEEDHRRIEAAFRLFINKADWAITDGDTNNIPSGAAIGALMCSLAIQDMHWIRRFIDGPGGYRDMVATGILDDGWYFEVASNYVVLFADMFTRAAQACIPWGIHLQDLRVPPSFFKNAMLSPWSMPRDKPFLGMSFQKFGPVARNCRSVKDVCDAMLAFVDYRGILFGTNDSTDKDVVRLYDLAYYVWRDPRYVSVIKNGGPERRDLIYGVGELPEADATLHERSAYADNAGLCVLRSRAEGRSAAERIQAVIKYGTHGGYHGHFDRTGLVSVARYGRNAYGPLAAWYGYASFMFKMWVQASLSHNMVVVDQRMQEPAESKRLLFHSGCMMQAAVVETVARWSDPPYGGQTPYPQRFPEDRAWIEGREVLPPGEPRNQGDIGEYSEPVLQRRLTIVTDDYVAVADMLRAEQEHTFDCLYHFQGYAGIVAKEKRLLRHTATMNRDPYGAGQFVADCDWYACDGPTVVRFSHEYDPERDDADGRHIKYNESGRMNTDVHALWPPRQEVMTGRYPEADAVNKRLTYTVSGDGKTLAEGRFGAWILGKREVTVPVAGVREITLSIAVEAAKKKTVFWGDPYVLTASGSKIPLHALPVRYDNVDPGNGTGADYYGGPVHLEGKRYEEAMPLEPLDRDKPAVASFDLSGVDAVSFHAVIGGDYPVGDDPARRTTVSFRSKGREARFITLLELYEGAPSIVSAEAESDNTLRVRLSGGRLQQIDISRFAGDGSDVTVRIREYRGGELTREETASAAK